MARNSTKPGYLPVTSITQQFSTEPGYVPDYALAPDFNPAFRQAGPGMPMGPGAVIPPGPPFQQHAGGTPQLPMSNYNGLTTADTAAVLSQHSNIQDHRPYGQRRYNNVGYLDVQTKNGLGNGVMAGSMYWTYNGVRQQASPSPVGQAYVPFIPGQTRGDQSGFVKRGPSQYNVQDWYNAGPGSQPVHPGGPGSIAGTTLYNPMSG